MPRGTTNLPQQFVAMAGGRQRDLCQNKGDARVTEALNSPIQGSGADCLVSALARLPKALADQDAKRVHHVLMKQDR